MGDHKVLLGALSFSPIAMVVVGRNFQKGFGFRPVWPSQAIPGLAASARKHAPQVGLGSSYLLGLLAKIKCCICSYQLNF